MKTLHLESPSIEGCVISHAIDCSDLRSSQLSPTKSFSTPSINITRSPGLSPTPAFTYSQRQSSIAPSLNGTHDLPVDLTFDDDNENAQDGEQTRKVMSPSNGLDLDRQMTPLLDLEPDAPFDDTRDALAKKSHEAIVLLQNARNTYEAALQSKDKEIAELSTRLKEQDKIVADRGADHLQAIWHKNRIIAIRKQKIANLETRERKLERDMRWSKDRGYDLEEENRWLRRKLREAYQILDSRERNTPDVQMLNVSNGRVVEVSQPLNLHL